MCEFQMHTEADITTRHYLRSCCDPLSAVNFFCSIRQTHFCATSEETLVSILCAFKKNENDVSGVFLCPNIYFKCKQKYQ